ncbi:outer membrane beta-barrel protein [Rheinheimera sp. WS51]|uniref:outer membrane beta-barrel protein n=1 Tax=Rheinheimera sp. WS51 TaxID=3425886 RepID=UPI003D8E188F
MMKKSILFSALFASAFTASAMADIRWDYVGTGYTDANVDGPYIEGSMRLDNNWVIDGRFSALSKNSYDVNILQAGVKYLTSFRLDFSPRSQTYVLAGLETEFKDGDETGAYGGVGVRHPLTPQVELYTEASYHSIYDNHASLSGGIAYFFSPDWAVRSNIALNSNDVKNEFRFGVSYQF